MWYKLWLPVFKLWDCNIFDRFHKINGFLDTIWYMRLNLVLFVFFLIKISNRKTIFPGGLSFFCRLHSLMDYLFQCGVSNSCRVNHQLNVRVRHGTRIYRLVVQDLNGIQTVFGVKSPEQLQSLLIYDCHFCLRLLLNVVVRGKDAKLFR